MGKLTDAPTAVCPACERWFDLPQKRHPIKAAVACPHCRARLEVLLGTRGAQRAERAKK